MPNPVGYPGPRDGQTPARQRRLASASWRCPWPSAATFRACAGLPA